MPNFAQTLKAEIVRLGRKEIKTAFLPLHRTAVALKKDTVNLKRRVAELEKNISFLLKDKIRTRPQIAPEELEKVRFTAKSIRKIRARLGLSQESFAKLAGISVQNVFIMEHKTGRLKLRASTLKSIISIRDLGKREARKRLEMLE
ncbi:MAG: hypothetical protein MUF22_07220 [Chitinispirillaceae bacterium]|nr:hypothetical protein [Chitinispirillaceae bacterium]